jgi:hypothetical protein
MPVIQALRSQRQEDHEFKASLCHIARSCLKKTKQIKETWYQKAPAWQLLINRNQSQRRKWGPDWPSPVLPLCIFGPLPRILTTHTHYPIPVAPTEGSICISISTQWGEWRKCDLWKEATPRFPCRQGVVGLNRHPCEREWVFRAGVQFKWWSTYLVSIRPWA